MLSAQIILNLDQALAHYGPETKPLRGKLKENAQKAYDTFWGGGDADPALLSVSARATPRPWLSFLPQNCRASVRQ